MATTRTSRSRSTGTGAARRRTSRTSSKSSETLSAQASRRVLRPVSDAMSSASRSVSQTVTDLPSWVPWVLGGIGVGALVYGLMQITAVSEFMSSVAEPIGEYFTGDEDEDSEDGEDLGSELSNGASAPGRSSM